MKNKIIILVGAVLFCKSTCCATLTVEWLNGTEQTESLEKIRKIEFKEDKINITDSKGNYFISNKLDQVKKIYFQKGEENNVFNTASERNISVYPNPTTNVLHIKGITEDEKVNLYNQDGKLIKSCQETEINMDDLPQGLYLLKVNTKVFKVVKK
ncbi:MAG: T9SS type A sorting domain-containing protein [Bacteroidales bacterium]|nr:T9SS type A sorting domain-containing protein [Bacteroidales bacterium]